MIGMAGATDPRSPRVSDPSQPGEEAHGSIPRFGSSMLVNRVRGDRVPGVPGRPMSLRE